MAREEYFLKFDEEAVLKLPYGGPLTRRIYIVFQRKNKEEIQEIFVQRRDAFAIDLIYSINRLRSHEISEIRYSCGLDGFIRIYLDEKAKLVGEYLCKSRSSLDNFREKLRLSI
jgi:hypothetical protein